MISDINNEDRLVQKTFADYLRDRLGWESVYAYHSEVFGASQQAFPSLFPSGEARDEGTACNLGRANERETVLVRDLRATLQRLNPELPEIAQAVIEKRLAEMLSGNPIRMDFYKKYQEIIADYNREKDRATVEETFARLVKLAESLDEEQQRGAREGLKDDELALFDLLYKKEPGKAEREKLRQASRSLLDSLRHHLEPMPHWTQNTQTQAEVEVFILDHLHASLPIPPFTADETSSVSHRIYEYIWQRSADGSLFANASFS